MNISSLIKLFGIAVAGFVPQAQANPFGISFVKVDPPPKDKKEEAICFRLKLSQTDVFSEHSFTDITFRPDTTVFLQKNMVINDEEEILKKAFKNFNADKDPFEIPEKYLPLEDKDHTEWVDKEGKPLKFLVAVKLGRVHYGVDLRYKEGDACLCISGKPKKPALYVDGSVIFIDGLECIVCKYPFTIDRSLADKLKKLKLEPKQKVRCMLSEGAMHNSLDTYTFQNVQVVFHHAGGEFFQFYHVPSGSYVEGKMGSTKIRSPLFSYTNGSSDQYSQSVSIQETYPHDGDYAVAVLVWDASQKSAKWSELRFGYDQEIKANIVSKGEWVVSVNVLPYTLTSVSNSFTGGSTEDLYKLIAKNEVEHQDEVKLSLKVHAFGFFFPKEQAQSNK